MILFGSLSAISQLASRVGGEGELGKIPRSSPYHYTWLRERGREGGSVPYPWSHPSCLFLTAPL
jgi:hypothetical protein